MDLTSLVWIKYLYDVYIIIIVLVLISTSTWCGFKSLVFISTPLWYGFKTHDVNLKPMVLVNFQNYKSINHYTINNYIIILNYYRIVIKFKKISILKKKG